MGQLIDHSFIVFLHSGNLTSLGFKILCRVVGSIGKFSNLFLSCTGYMISNRLIKNDECRTDVEENGTGLFQPLVWAFKGLL